MPKFNLQDEMRCGANLPEQLSQSQQPPPEFQNILTYRTHNTHLEFLHTLCGSAQEFPVYLLPQSCMFIGRVWTEQFYPRFFRYFCRVLCMQTVSPMEHPERRPAAGTSCRTYSCSCSSLLPHWQGRICLGLCSQALQDPSTSEWQVLLWQSNIPSLSLRIWASCLVNDWKGKSFFSGF